jgi:hypothetical protein
MYAYTYITYCVVRIKTVIYRAFLPQLSYHRLHPYYRSLVALTDTLYKEIYSQNNHNPSSA